MKQKQSLAPLKSQPTSKGQLISLDLLLSFAAFFLVCLFLLSLWDLNLTRLQDNIETEELELIAFQISDTLMNTPGVPFQWEDNISSVEMPGFAIERGLAEEEKINAFFSLDYNETKQKWNIERYDFQLKVYNEEGTLLQNTGPELNHSTLIALSRLALVNNQTYTFIFALGEAQT